MNSYNSHFSLFSILFLFSMPAFSLENGIKIEWFLIFFYILVLFLICLPSIRIQFYFSSSLPIFYLYFLWLAFSGYVNAHGDVLRITLSLGAIFIFSILHSVKIPEIRFQSELRRIVLIGGFILTILPLIWYLYLLFFEGKDYLELAKILDVNELTPDYFPFEILYGLRLGYQGLHGDPNLVAGLVSFFLFSFYYSGSKISKISSIFFAVAIFLSLSRGGIISVCLAFIFLSVKRNKILSLNLLAVMFLFPIFLVTVSALVNIHEKIMRGANARFYQWNYVYENMEVTMLGHGFNSVKRILGKQAESGYIHLLYEHGVIGLILFFFLAFYTHQRACILIKNNPDNVMMGVIGFFYTSIFLNVFTLHHFSYLFLLSCILILNCGNSVSRAMRFM